MLKNYIIIAIRNLGRQKVLSVINITGLSMGLACFTLFLLFAVNEFSYDSFHQSKEIYRVAEWYEGFPNREPGGESYGGTPAGPAMKQDLPAVKDYVRVQTGFADRIFKVGNEITRGGMSFVDPQIFNVFSFPLVAGNKNALNDPRNIVLTQTKAKELFGFENAVGQRVEIKMGDQFEPFIVGAVMKDIPSNSSIRFNIAGSFVYFMEHDGKESLNNWTMSLGVETFVQLKDGSNLPQDLPRLMAFRKKYYPDEEEWLKKDGVWKGQGTFPVRFMLQPITSVHTNAKIGGMSSTIDPKYIWMLIGIAGGILLIACINFTTLAIGRSAGRAKEVGVRKVMGGWRKNLLYQFLVESIILSILSAVLAVFIVILLLPFFNQLTGVKTRISFSEFPQLPWMLAGLVLLTGLIAGIYPALVLSGFKPVDVLKSKIKLGGSNLFTRSLVTGQFVLSVGLIICTVIILQQMHFMRTQNIGFSKEHVISLDTEGADMTKVYPLLKQKLQAEPTVQDVTASEMGLGEGTGLMGFRIHVTGDEKDKGVIVYPVDANYIKVMGMQLIAGRNFDPALSIDTSSSVIINESMLHDLGLTVGNAVGKQFEEKGFRDESKQRVIIGVVKNFNYSKLNETVRSQMFFQPSRLEARKIFVRVKPGHSSKAVASIKTAWSSLVPGLPFRYSFLDEDFDRFYKTEERWGRIAGSAGAVCIFLACLGLLGLAALAAVNRTKEIGVRKVLGASISSIVTLLSKDFLKLIGIAILIATPLAWYGMHQWLQNYAYRINISLWIFVGTGLLALFIALVTISIQAIKAAMAKPVKSLKTE